MAFQFKMNQEELSGPKPVPPGVYTVRFVQFKPKMSKKKEDGSGGDSLNFNAEVEIVGGEYDGRKLFAGLNTKIPTWIQDFVHSFGVEMSPTGEVDPKGNPEYTIPGIFDAEPATFNEHDPSTWKYAGPLVGKTAQWEVGIKTYQGKEQNEPRQFICAVDKCNEKFPWILHAKDMKSKD